MKLPQEFDLHALEVFVMAVELGAAPAAGIGIEEEDKAVSRGLAKRTPLSRIPRV